MNSRPPDVDPSAALVAVLASQERVLTAQIHAAFEVALRPKTPYAGPPSDHLGLRTLEVFAEYCTSIGDAPEKDVLLLKVCAELHRHTGRILAAAEADARANAEPAAEEPPPLNDSSPAPATDPSVSGDDSSDAAPDPRRPAPNRPARRRTT